MSRVAGAGDGGWRYAYPPYELTDMGATPTPAPPTSNAPIPSGPSQQGTPGFAISLAIHPKLVLGI